MVSYWVLGLACTSQKYARQNLLERSGLGRLEGFVCSLHQRPVDGTTADGFHHGEMFPVLMCLEQSIAREQLDQNASYAPNVAGVRPIHAEYDFGSSVVPS